MTEQRRMVQVYDGDGVKDFVGWAPCAACLCCYDLIDVGSTLCERCEHQYKDCDCDRGKVDGESCSKCGGQAYVRKNL